MDHLPIHTNGVILRLCSFRPRPATPGETLLRCHSIKARRFERGNGASMYVPDGCRRCGLQRPTPIHLGSWTNSKSHSRCKKRCGQRGLGDTWVPLAGRPRVAATKGLRAGLTAVPEIGGPEVSAAQAAAGDSVAEAVMRALGVLPAAGNPSAHLTSRSRGAAAEASEGASPCPIPLRPSQRLTWRELVSFSSHSR